MRRQLWILAAGAVLATLSPPPPAQAQDDAIDRTPQDCIRTSRTRSTRVIDDQTILFYMRGGQVFRNDMPNHCPGLAREDTFAYETRVGRLCQIDTITVLEDFGGRFVRGATCRLGEFSRITPEEAADIVAGPEGAKRGNEDVDIEEVELPEDDEAADDETE